MHGVLPGGTVMLWRTLICGLLFVIPFKGPVYSQEQGAPPASAVQATPPAAPANQTAPPAAAHRAQHGGSIPQPKLIHWVPPKYPEDAKNAHISGTVRLHGVIAKDGSVRIVQYVWGPKELKQAGVD